VDPLLGVVLVLLALSNLLPGGPLVGGLLLLALLLFVVVHEGAHAWAARRRGLAVEGIFIHLLPVTYLQAGPPPDEWRVALAGPVANLLLGLLFAALGLVSGLFSGRDAMGVLTTPLGFALGANLALGVVNLVPVLPADGGRALRALLSLAFGPVAAACTVGWLGASLGAAGAIFVAVTLTWPAAVWLFALALYVMVVGLAAALRPH